MNDNNILESYAIPLAEEPVNTNGLLGYYFSDYKFCDLSFIRMENSSPFQLSRAFLRELFSHDQKREIRSARWMGCLMIPEGMEGSYVFSALGEPGIEYVIQVDGIIVSTGMGVRPSIEVQSGRMYNIMVEYICPIGLSNDQLIDIQLQWGKLPAQGAPGSGVYEPVPFTSLFPPDFREIGLRDEENLDADDRDVFQLIPKRGLFSLAIDTTDNIDVSDTNILDDSEIVDEIIPLADFDNDGIPVDWEINGYTKKNGVIVKWENSFDPSVYIKYRSNPRLAFTTRDPYTDFEKVMGYPLVPGDLLSVALHPCVAAYPVATVAMERLIVSRNETVVEGQSNTIAMSTTKTTTTTKSWEVGGEFSVAPPKPPAVLGENLCVTGDNECVNNVIAPNFFGAFLGSIMSGIGSGFKISSKYANSTQTSTAVQNSSSDTWTKQISINTAETGYMNANVRFINTGTAPIRNAAPTINIVINETDHSVATVRANNNTISDYLPADGSYPAKGLSPISFTQASSTGAVKMPLNYEQITLLDAGTYTLGLQTPQVTGDYQVMVDGRPVTKQSWADFRGQIDGATATLVLFDSANTDTSSVNLYERKVAARRNSPEDTTPELTLREGILLAFDMKFDRGYFVYKNRYFDDFSMHIITDTQTGKEIQRQLDNNQISSIYDVKLRPDMNFTISLPSWVCDFDYSTKPWYYAGTGNYGYMGKGALTTYSSGWTQNAVPLEPNTQYSLRAIVKTDRTTPTKVQLGLTDAISKRTGPYLEIDVANSWKFVEMTFTTDLHPERYAYIFFHGLNSQKIYFDSVSIAKFDEMELKPSKVLWVSRQDGQSIDLTNQTAFTIPSNYEDSAGKNGLDLIFIDKETGEPLDMRDYDIVRSDIKILSDTTTSDAYKIKGHVNLNILAKGTTVLSVRQKRSKKLLKQFVVTSNVSPTSPHFVKKWHASGHSWKTKTKGNYPYAVGFNWSWNGYKAQAQEYIESYTVQLNGSSKRRTFPFSDVDKYTSGFYFYKSNDWSYDWALSKNGLMELTANMKDGSKVLVVQKWYWF